MALKLLLITPSRTLGPKLNQTSSVPIKGVGEARHFLAEFNRWRTEHTGQGKKSEESVECHLDDDTQDNNLDLHCSNGN